MVSLLKCVSPISINIEVLKSVLSHNSREASQQLSPHLKRGKWVVLVSQSDPICQEDMLHASY